MITTGVKRLRVKVAQNIISKRRSKQYGTMTHLWYETDVRIYCPAYNTTTSSQNVFRLPYVRYV